ncbi:ATP-binding protein [Streptomyces sp. C8S0]|uniref:ATP-binding protein n=1 Tax=Streptomyces sp. C8S0 TaxID=2585716 RepID=UPI0039B04705
MVLAASELVANATEHAVGPYEIRLRRTTAEVLCEVEDHDPRIPELSFPAAAPYAPWTPTAGWSEALCALLTGGAGACTSFSTSAGARGASPLRAGRRSPGSPSRSVPERSPVSGSPAKQPFHFSTAALIAGTSDERCLAHQTRQMPSKSGKQG